MSSHLIPEIKKKKKLQLYTLLLLQQIQRDEKGTTLFLFLDLRSLSLLI